MLLGDLAGRAQDLTKISRQDPVKLSGVIDLRGIFYRADGIPGRYPAASVVLSGSPTLTVYGLEIPFSFTFSNQEKKFMQPFNQFGMSPTYKWLTVHAGYRNVSWSPFTLGGHTMLGGGVELTPGKWRLGVMYGRLNRATTLDSTTLSLVPIAFSRMGYAARIGYGTAANFLEFSVIKAKDDPGSLQMKSYLDTALPGVYAAENLAGGLTTRFSLARRWQIEGDFGLSIYTKDSQSPVRFDADTDPMLSRLRKLINLNLSTAFYTAATAGIRYKFRDGSFRIQYRRIDPDYKTMGAYFFQSDLENVTVSPAFSAFSRHLRFSGSIGLQRDNLKNQKKATSRKLIGSASLGIDFTPELGLDAAFSNFSTNQTPTTTRFADSLRITQTTQSLTVMPRYIRAGKVLTHSLTGLGMLTRLNDFNSLYATESQTRALDSRTLSVTYSLTWQARQLTLSATASSASVSSETLSDSNEGLTLGVDKTAWKNKCALRMSAGYLRGDRSGTAGTILNGSLGVQYRMTRSHSLLLNTSYWSNRPDDVTVAQPAYSELRGEIAYQYTF